MTDRSATLAQANSVPQTFVRELRKLRVFNSTNETAPPHACMQVSSQSQNGSEVVYVVRKPGSTVVHPSANSLLRQEKFVFNLNRPLPKQSYGEATADFPCQALFRPTNPTTAAPFGTASATNLSGVGSFGFAAGSACGPVAGEWWLTATAGAFVCRAFDASEPIGTGPLKTIWIDPAIRRQAAYAAAYIMSNDSFAAGSFDTVAAGKFLTLRQWSELRGAADVTSIGGRPALQVAQDGIYSVHAHATFGSPDASRGALLIIQAYHLPASGVFNSNAYIGPLTLARFQDIEQDIDSGTHYAVSPSITYENVAVSFPLKLLAGEAITFRNTSANSLSIHRIGSGAWLNRIADYDQLNHNAPLTSL